MYTRIQEVLRRELLSIGTLVVAMLFATTVVRHLVLPLWTQDKAIAREMQRYQALISSNSQYVELKKEIRQKQRRLEARYSELTKGIKVHHELSPVLQIVFDKALAAGMRFDKTTPQQEVVDKEYRCYPVILETATSYTALGTFIASLEEMPQVVRVDRIAFTVQENGLLQTRIMVTCFVAAS